MERKARKQQLDGVLVDCMNCKHSDGIIKNYMIGCRNAKVNPRGYKMGYWPRVCIGFEAKHRI
jgi:hypothetical protein